MLVPAKTSECAEMTKYDNSSLTMPANDNIMTSNTMALTKHITMTIARTTGIVLGSAIKSKRVGRINIIIVNAPACLGSKAITHQHKIRYKTRNHIKLCCFGKLHSLTGHDKGCIQLLSLFIYSITYDINCQHKTFTQ